MNNKSLIEKFEKFKQNIKEFVDYKKSDIEDIHGLRVSSRELFSLLSSDNEFRKHIKKVIKLSNKIRDLDVFFEEYLPSLPKKYIDELDIDNILESANRSRAKDIEKIHLYLKYLIVPQELEFKYEEKKFDYTKIDVLEFNQAELHKYRIYIKKVLSKEKNTTPKNEKKIKLLTKIKDVLGSINDNDNGLKRLETYEVEPVLFKEINDFTNRKNLALFEEFKIVNQHYMEMPK